MQICHCSRTLPCYQIEVCLALLYTPYPWRKIRALEKLYIFLTPTKTGINLGRQSSCLIFKDLWMNIGDYFNMKRPTWWVYQITLLILLYFMSNQMAHSTWGCITIHTFARELRRSMFSYDDKRMAEHLTFFHLFNFNHRLTLLSPSYLKFSKRINDTI